MSTIRTTHTPTWSLLSIATPAGLVEFRHHMSSGVLEVTMFDPEAEDRDQRISLGSAEQLALLDLIAGRNRPA